MLCFVLFNGKNNWVLHADRKELVKKEKIKGVSVESVLYLVKDLGFRAQEEWLDLYRSARVHRREGRMYGTR